MPTIPDIVYQFHKRGDHYVTYVAINTTVGATSYYQYQSVDGYWYIMKGIRAGVAIAYTFTKPVNTDAAIGWAARAAPATVYTTLPLAFGG